MVEVWLAASTGMSLCASAFALLAFLATRRHAVSLTRQEADELLRRESEAIRAAGEASARGLRQEIGQTLAQNQTATLDAAHQLREELGASFQRMRQGVSETLNETSAHQKERLESAKQAIDLFSQQQTQAAEQLRLAVEGRLDLIRQENTTELEKMRATVDEKLQTTLEKRLGESFGRIVEHLNKAYEVFGEMRTISASVGDLKNVLTNPKLRGTFGEAQLAMLIQDFLSPSQYIMDAQVKDGSAERVEFAIRLPTIDGHEILMPVDAKFPREDHEHMIAAYEAGDMEKADYHRKQLENRIKASAKDISRKYINPPRTTEHAILFLPTESLFAEALRLPGLVDHIRREWNVAIAGPTTFASVLQSYQAGHRSMSIAQQSAEVWKILSAVRTEFRKYNDTVGRVAKQLNTAVKSVDDLGARTRAMDRALKTVETMPDNGSSARLLGLGEVPGSEADTSWSPAPAGELVLTNEHAAG